MFFFNSITEPVRYFSTRTNSEVKYYEAKCTDIDPKNNKITCKGKNFFEEFSKKKLLNY